MNEIFAQAEILKKEGLEKADAMVAKLMTLIKEDLKRAIEEKVDSEMEELQKMGKSLDEKGKRMEEMKEEGSSSRINS